MIITTYSEQLSKDAISYMSSCFTNKKLGVEANANVIAAAMAVIQGVGWFQESTSPEEAIQNMIDSGQLVVDEDDNVTPAGDPK